MRRIFPALALAAVLASASSAAVGPSLRLLQLDPITVAGSNFHPLARVAVTVTAERTVTRTARATRSGSFRIAFTGLTASRCSGGKVRAVAGGKVVGLAIPAPACMAHQ